MDSRRERDHDRQLRLALQTFPTPRPNMWQRQHHLSALYARSHPIPELSLSLVL